VISLFNILYDTELPTVGDKWELDNFNIFHVVEVVSDQEIYISVSPSASRAGSLRWSKEYFYQRVSRKL
jgi:hypothetical protein